VVLAFFQLCEYHVCTVVWPARQYAVASGFVAITLPPTKKVYRTCARWRTGRKLCPAGVYVDEIAFVFLPVCIPSFSGACTGNYVIFQIAIVPAGITRRTLFVIGGGNGPDVSGEHAAKKPAVSHRPASRESPRIIIGYLVF